MPKARESLQAGHTAVQLSHSAASFSIRFVWAERAEIQVMTLQHPYPLRLAASRHQKSNFAESADLSSTMK